MTWLAPTGHWRTNALSRACVLSRAGVWAIRLGCVLGLTGILVGTMDASPSLAATLTATPDFAVARQDGLLTAVFASTTDDAALTATLPALSDIGVQAISLRGAPVRDIRPLARLVGLKALDISGTQVRDITPLSGLAGLQTLNLQFLPISDLRPLGGLVNLRTLNLGGTEVSDLSPLASLANLRDLVAAVSKVEDLSPLAPLHQLTSLDLGSTWVSNLRPLADMANLTYLSLNGTPVADLRPLSGMAALQRLDLGGTQVADVRPLAPLRHLASLDLEGTQVADVSPLAGLTELRSLALGGSRVKDMTPLANLALGGKPPARPAPPATKAQGVDAVLVWNDQTNRAIQQTSTDPFAASRDLALESIAVLDTLKSMAGAPGYLVRLPAPGDVPAEIAIAAAAHTMLGHLFPSQQKVLDTALAAALAQSPEGPARNRAVDFGKAMAEAVLAMREGDGFDGTGTTHDGTAPGQWRPTPPNFQPAMHPQWATLEPFALTTPSQFRPAGPPGPGTAAFNAALATVASIGDAHSTIRTAEQTEIAHYWSDAIGTYAPAGHWNAITASLVAPQHLGLEAEAELFAELNVAIADAGIAMADAKYTYWSWRPITAIRAGGDGVAPIADWSPLLETPNHPSYISGHSAFSGAASVVLAAKFGERGFTFASPSLPGATRSFTSFQQAAEEAAASRVYGGIHFPFDNADGLATGRAVGTWTVSVFRRIAEDRGPFLMAERSIDMGGKSSRAVMGCALDNLQPIVAVTGRLDGGEPFSIAVDDRGLFELPPQRLGSSGRHEMVLQAISVTGRSNQVRLEIGG